MSGRSHDKIAEAYLAMAKHAKYPPEAPTDGCGNIQLSTAEIGNQERLRREASAYAIRFMREEDGHVFRLGVSNFVTKEAFVWAIEAARSLAAAENRVALRLLKMAVADLEQSSLGATIDDQREIAKGV